MFCFDQKKTKMGTEKNIEELRKNLRKLNLEIFSFPDVDTDFCVLKHLLFIRDVETWLISYLVQLLGINRLSMNVLL